MLTKGERSDTVNYSVNCLWNNIWTECWKFILWSNSLAIGNIISLNYEALASEFEKNEANVSIILDCLIMK